MIEYEMKYIKVSTSLNLKLKFVSGNNTSRFLCVQPWEHLITAITVSSPLYAPFIYTLPNCPISQVPLTLDPEQNLQFHLLRMAFPNQA